MATLDVHLVTPEREVWAGPAGMVVARGIAGEVGILPGHAPLLIRLAIGVLRIRDVEGRWQDAVVDGGFLHVTSGAEDTRVDVLAAYSELAGEIDRRAAEARVEEMRAKLHDAEDAEARAELAKALARVELTRAR